MRGSLTFEDFLGKKTNIPVLGLDPNDATIMTKMQALALSLQSYVNAAIVDYGVLRPEIQVISGDNATTGPYDSSFNKALVNFSYVEDNEQKYITLFLPAPDLQHFDTEEEVGYRMFESSGNAIRDALRTATGITDLEFVRGVTEYREGKSSRPSEGAYAKWRDFDGRIQYMGVSKVTDIAALQTFCESFLRGSAPYYSNCALLQVGIITPEIATRDEDPATESGYDSIDQRAVLNFSWVENAKRRTMQMTLPAMKESSFVPVSRGKKKYVTQAVGDGVALALTALYGAGVRDLTFESGTRDIVNLQEA